MMISLAYNHKQPGDPRKGVNVIIDVVKREGVAKNKAIPPAILLGRDCYNSVTGILTKAIETFEDWKDISTSTDRDGL